MKQLVRSLAALRILLVLVLAPERLVKPGVEEE